MPSSKITAKGQITLPVEVRRALKVRPGDRVSFRTARDGTVTVEPETVDLVSLKGSVPTPVRGVSVSDMERAIARAHRRK